MREKRLLWNTVTAILNQAVTVVCAFILPRLILTSYGSVVNGLIQSIQQFMAVIAFLDMGVGAVVQSSLYQPLAKGDMDGVSRIMVSANRFFRKLAAVIGAYIAVLSVSYTFISHSSFSVGYTCTLVLALGASYFAQYYFGLKNQLLLIADQKAYVQNLLNIVVVILNNALGCLLILAGFSIQTVKISTALILLTRPLLMELYVRRHYPIRWDIRFEGEPIRQKWNGIAQHLASVVLHSTDNIVLTLFSDLKNVSIYSVYHLVLNGMNSLVLSFTQSASAYFGNLLANREHERLQSMFCTYETLFHAAIVFLYSCITALIMPFVSVYTKGVSDAEYIVPLFAYLICGANMVYCLRLPYNSLVLSAGHYKQTQSSAIVEMALNLVISVAAVIRFGLVGVAVGTLAAMLYRSTYLAWYAVEHILRQKSLRWLLHFAVDLLCVLIVVAVSGSFAMSSPAFYAWIVLAIKVGAVSLLVTVGVNALVFGKNLHLRQMLPVFGRRRK